MRSTWAAVMVSEALLPSLLESESEVVVATVAVLASTRGDGGEAIHVGRAVKVNVSTSFAASEPTAHEIRLLPALKLHVPLLGVRATIVYPASPAVGLNWSDRVTFWALDGPAFPYVMTLVVSTHARSGVG